MLKERGSMAEASRIHPLQDRSFAGAGITLTPAPVAERYSLRARPDGAKKVGKAIGLSLPVKPQTSVSKDGVFALWLGPDEWLLIAPAGTGLEERFTKAAGTLFSAVDVSHRNTAIIAEGEKVEAVLNSGCPRDLSITAFPPGACARTILAKSEVILYRETATRFRVECWRSFSDYVWLYLVDAAKSA
jgi:sarcosine oxidase subunit gamma